MLKNFLAPKSLSSLLGIEEEKGIILSRLKDPQVGGSRPTW